LAGGALLGGSHPGRASAGAINVDQFLETQGSSNSFGNVMALQDGLGVIGYPIFLGTVAPGSYLMAAYPNQGVDISAFGFCGDTTTSYSLQSTGYKSVTATNLGYCGGCINFAGTVVLLSSDEKSALAAVLNGTDCPKVGNAEIFGFSIPVPARRELLGTFTALGSGTLAGSTSSGKVSGWIFDNDQVYLHIETQD
jgi:hypothetical protein